MIEQLGAFVLVAVIVIIVPGPDMVLVFRNAARSGRPGAVSTIGGILLGNAIMGTAAALGVTALFMASTTVFHVVRIAGGLYLLYLGVAALRSYLALRRGATDPATPLVATVPASRATSFRQGLICNLLNPKLAAFYLSLFPQFQLAPLPPVAQYGVLAALFWCMALLWYVVLVGFLTALHRLLYSPVFARRIEAVAGSALVALGVAVLARPE